MTISEGDFRFSDRSITPAVGMAINHFGGVISGLASTNLAKADVDLKAMVDGAGPVAITGKLDPLGAKPLAEATTVDDNDLRALAQARAERVREYFASVGKIAADRLFLAKDRADGEKQGKGPRVFLPLR